MKSILMAAIAALFFASLAHPANAMSKSENKYQVKIEQSVEFSARRHRHRARHNARRVPAWRGATGAINCDRFGCSDRGNAKFDANSNAASQLTTEISARRPPAEAVITGSHDLVTVDTCAGIKITVSSDFAAKIQRFICAQVERGVEFATIHCAASRGHVRGSLHYSGNACDHRIKRGRANWNLAGDYGLRDGCTFMVGRKGHRHPDCGHVDNAYAFGHPYVARGSQPRRTQMVRQ